MQLSSTLIAVLALATTTIAVPVAAPEPVAAPAAPAYSNYGSYGSYPAPPKGYGSYGAYPAPSPTHTPTPTPTPAKYASYGGYPKLPSYTTYKRAVEDFVKNIFG